MVHRGPGVLDDGVCLKTVHGEYSDANAAGQRELVVRYMEGSGDRAAYALANPRG
jgi:hypothetical protein